MIKVRKLLGILFFLVLLILMFGQICNAGVFHCASIQDLKALTPPSDSSTAVVDGYWTIFDGGGGTFYWDEDSTEAENEGTVFCPNVYPGTGRWKRLISDTINIKMFGAKGNGNSYEHDETAIQNAINYANSTNYRTVYFPKGIYFLDSCINVPSNMHIVGDNAILRTTPVTKDIHFTLLLSMSNVTNVYIEGLTFDGEDMPVIPSNDPTKGADKQNTVVVYQSSYVVFDKCNWINTYGVAVSFSFNNSYCGVRNSHFNHWGKAKNITKSDLDRMQAIIFFNGSIFSNVGNFATDNVFVDGGLDAIAVQTQTGAKVSGNYILNNQAGSIYVEGSTLVRIENNYISNGLTGGNGIDVGKNNNDISPSNIDIIGNICYGCGAAGIMVADVLNCTIQGNTCINNNQTLNDNPPQINSVHNSGIVIHTATEGILTDGISVSGNICTDTQLIKTQLYGLCWTNTVINEPFPLGKRIYIGNDNVFEGNKINDVSPNIAFKDSRLKTVTLPPGGTYTLCSSNVRAILDIIRINDDKIAKVYLKVNWVLPLYDYGSGFAYNGSGAEDAIFYDPTTLTFILKNNCPVVRTYNLQITMADQYIPPQSQ